MTEQDWWRCPSAQVMLAHLSNRVTSRKLRLYAVACCNRVVHLLPVGSRWWDGLLVALRHADGQATRGELVQAVDQAEATRRPGNGKPGTNASVAFTLAAEAVFWATRVNRRTYASNAANTAAAAAAYAVLPPKEPYIPPAQSKHYGLWLATEAAERAAQVAFVHDLCGNPFQPMSLDPACRTPVARRLAQVAYEERGQPRGELDPHRLAVLADALEDEGVCAAILDHFRQPGPHAPGCWAVDAVLGLS